VNGNRRNKLALRICFGSTTLSVGSCIVLEPIRVPLGVGHAPNLYFISNHHHIRVCVLFRSYLSLNSVVVHQFVRPPPRDQYSFDCVLPVLACVLDCACKDKPSWWGHSCVTGDNQWSSGVAIARICSLGALDHQRRGLHPIKLSYLTEDRASPSISLHRDVFHCLACLWITQWPLTTRVLGFMGSKTLFCASVASP
jgi:hypothetical protein